MDFSVLQAAEWGDEGTTLHEALSPGDVLTILHGPLWVDGMPWYHIAESPPYSAWVHPEEPEVGVWGWVPGADAAGIMYLRIEDLEQDPSFDLVAAGIGGGHTEEVPAQTSQGLTWVAAAGGPTSTCAFRLIVEATGEVIADEQVEGFQDGSTRWPASTASAIQVESDCAWYIQVQHGVQ